MEESNPYVRDLQIRILQIEDRLPVLRKELTDLLKTNTKQNIEKINGHEMRIVGLESELKRAKNRVDFLVNIYKKIDRNLKASN